MAQGVSAAFISYSRKDSEFALRLAEGLKAVGANVWLDQLDIVPGQRWDRTVEDALSHCPRMLLVLSPASVNSTNVMDEVSFALEEKKTVIPIMFQDCPVPFRLRRVQYVDFRQDYSRGLRELLKTLGPEPGAERGAPAASEVRPRAQSDAAKGDAPESASDRKKQEPPQAPIQAAEVAAADLSQRPASEALRPNKTEISVEESRRPYVEGHEVVPRELVSLKQGNVKSLSSWGLRLFPKPSVWAGALAMLCGIAIVAWVLHRSVARNPPDATVNPSSEEQLKTEAPLSGWIVGTKGTILHTEDDGRSWRWQRYESGNLDLYAVDFVTPQSGWIVGDVGAVLHTEDGGRTWQKQNSIWVLQNLLGVTFMTSQSGWIAGGDGTILHTEDAGRTWQNIDSGSLDHLLSVDFVTPQSGWIAGAAGTILHTEDGGHTWQKQSSRTIEYLWGVTFIATRSGWIAGDKGTILHTDDGGQTWKKQDSGTTAELFAVTFTTSHSGWVVGHGGTILHTDDGGQTWQKQDSGTTAELLGVTFTTSRSGWTTGGNGTILHTDDGGQTWQKQDSGTTEGLWHVTFVSPRKAAP